MATSQLHRAQTDEGPRMLGEEHREEVAAFLSSDVALNLFQLCWLENHGVAPGDRPEMYHFSGLFDRLGELQAVALVITERLLLLHAVEPEAAAAVGRWYRRHDFVFEHVVSGRDSVTPFWNAYAAADGAESISARLNRPQQLYSLERRRWFEQIRPEGRQKLEPTGVAFASLDQLEAIYLASARMHREETHEDPLQTQPEAFRRHVRHRIRTDRTFAWFDERQLIFKADLSAISSVGAQISGVYTPPLMRGRGIATRALFDICEELFESGLPRITLYVNAENEPARRVYRKVGFQLHADYQTVFVQSSHRQ